MKLNTVRGLGDKRLAVREGAAARLQNSGQRAIEFDKLAREEYDNYV